MCSITRFSAKDHFSTRQQTRACESDAENKHIITKRAFNKGQQHFHRVKFLVLKTTRPESTHSLSKGTRRSQVNIESLGALSKTTLGVLRS